MTESGHDRAGRDAAQTPVVILVETQMAENVGATMRAMANFGLARLRLVNPREAFPNDKAVAMASGADGVLDAVETFGSFEAALADLNLVFATTARTHDLAKPVVSPATAAPLMRASIERGETVGIVFGRERNGLTSDEVALCDQILTIPVDPRFPSLNVGQAVLTVAYEWRKVVIGDATWTPFPEKERSPLARKEDVLGMFEHLEGALGRAEFFRPAEKRPSMVRNLRSLFQKARLTEQEVRSLRGIVAALERRPTRPTAPKNLRPRPEPPVDEGDGQKF